MSRSWERMVQRNAKKVNQQRKKQGKPALYERTPNVDKFKGRNYIVPLLVVMLMAFYIYTFGPWVTKYEDTTMFWVTVLLYALLAVMYFFRRPYLNVTRDTLETRKFTGYKTLRPGDIRKIVLAPGYVIIEPVKGSNWVFSRYINLYPIDKMSERLKTFSEANRVELEVRMK